MMKKVSITEVKTLSSQQQERENSIEDFSFNFGEQYILPVSTLHRIKFYVVQEVKFRNLFGDVVFVWCAFLYFWDCLSPVRADICAYHDGIRGVYGRVGGNGGAVAR
jgi:hypothetical protein